MKREHPFQESLAEAPNRRGIKHDALMRKKKKEAQRSTRFRPASVCGPSVLKWRDVNEPTAVGFGAQTNYGSSDSADESAAESHGFRASGLHVGTRV